MKKTIHQRQRKSPSSSSNSRRPFFNNSVDRGKVQMKRSDQAQPFFQGTRDSAEPSPGSQQVVQRMGEQDNETQLKRSPDVLQRVDMDQQEDVQLKTIDPLQREANPEEEKPLQAKSGNDARPNPSQTTTTPGENRTGMPSRLKSGLEQLSGYDLSGVRVNYNSSKPAQLNALAYAQGQNIEVGPGQERHLPHEGWHVVQQMQGRVNPTLQTKGVPINDNATLEHEADQMGAKAARNPQRTGSPNGGNIASSQPPKVTPIQRRKGEATDARLDHIFLGEKAKNKDKTSITGYHSENEASNAVAMVPNDAEKRTGGEGGVYTAKPLKPSAKGLKQKLTDKKAGSSFFPSTMDRAAVKKLIEGAQIQSKGSYNRVGDYNGNSIPMKLADESIYPIFIDSAVEEAGAQSGRGKKKR